MSFPTRDHARRHWPNAVLLLIAVTLLGSLGCNLFTSSVSAALAPTLSQTEATANEAPPLQQSNATPVPTSAVTPIARPALATYMSWSLDDRYLFYSEDSNPLGMGITKQWTVYDTQAHTSTTQGRLPFLPQLSPQALATFAPAPKTFYFASPDDRFVAFFRGSGANNWTLWLGNRTTFATFNTGIAMWDATDLLNVKIEWSKDSSAFAVFHARNEQAPYIDYVKGYQQGFSSTLVKLDIVQNVVAGEQFTSAVNLYGLTADGSEVLLTVGRTSSDSHYESYFALYDPLNPSNGKVLHNLKLTGTTAIGDAQLVDWQPSQLVINSDLGLLIYDIATDTFTKLNPIFYRDAALSRDGRQIAIFAQYDGIYIVPVTYLSTIFASGAQAVTSTVSASPTLVVPTIIVSQAPSAAAFNDPPGCHKPPEDYGKLAINGSVINARTLWMLKHAQALYGGKLDFTNRGITQGSYTGGLVTASFGTHDGGGAVDLAVIDPQTGKVMTNDLLPALHALRVAGFAAWVRLPGELYPGSPIHIHAIAIGDAQLSQPARDQLTGEFGYFRGYDGLPQTNHKPIPDRYGGPILCQWMLDMGYRILS